MARKRQYTAWAAALATAAELSRRSYDVTITFGNTPKVDLLCSVPDGKQFKVQVKGISSRNALFIQKHFLEGTLEPNLFLVIVLFEDNKPLGQVPQEHVVWWAAQQVASTVELFVMPRPFWCRGRVNGR